MVLLDYLNQLSDMDLWIFTILISIAGTAALGFLGGLKLAIVGLMGLGVILTLTGMIPTWVPALVIGVLLVWAIFGGRSSEA